MKRWHWYVYIIECKDGLYYTGLTWNLSNRIEQHKNGKGSNLPLNTDLKNFVILRNLLIYCKHGSESIN